MASLQQKAKAKVLCHQFFTFLSSPQRLGENETCFLWENCKTRNLSWVKFGKQAVVNSATLQFKRRQWMQSVVMRKDFALCPRCGKKSLINLDWYQNNSHINANQHLHGQRRFVSSHAYDIYISDYHSNGSSSLRIDSNSFAACPTMPLITRWILKPPLGSLPGLKNLFSPSQSRFLIHSINLDSSAVKGLFWRPTAHLHSLCQKCYLTGDHPLTKKQNQS